MVVRRRRPDPTELADAGARPRALRPVTVDGGRASVDRQRGSGRGHLGCDHDGPAVSTPLRGRGGDGGARGDHSFRGDGQTQRAEQTRPHVQDGTPRRTGHRNVGVTGAASADTVGGVTRQEGIQASPNTDPRHLRTTYNLLSQLAARPGEPVKIRLGRETFTAGQLKRELEMNVDRMGDFLRQHGVTVGELNEALDDIVASNPAAGQTFDLRRGTDLARRYSLGDGVDNLRDSRTPMATAAARNSGLAEGLDLQNRGADGPNALEQIGEAFLEAFAWIGRLFGSTWNPDTATFNGALDAGVEQRFEEGGRQMGREKSTALRALLATPNGRANLERALQADRPENVPEANWNRAVQATLRGIDAQLQASTGPTFSGTQAADALTYLRSQNFSAEAQQQVDRIMAQPAEIRTDAMRLLVTLPAPERARLLNLMAPEGELADNATLTQEAQFYLRFDYGRASDQAKVAIFRTMQQDGFRSPTTSGPVANVRDAAQQIDFLSPANRTRYLALLPRLGMNRAHYLNESTVGLRAQLQRAPADQRAQILSDFESRLNNSGDLQSHLGVGQFSLRLTTPRPGGRMSSGDRRRAVGAFELHNVRLRLRDQSTGQEIKMSARGEGANELSLDRYLSDRTYRADVLQRTGLTQAGLDHLIRNVSGSLRSSHNSEQLRSAANDVQQAQQGLANASNDAERGEAQRTLDDAVLRLRTIRVASNIDLDVRPGSNLHNRFNLSGQGDSAQTQAVAERLKSSYIDVNLRVRGQNGPVVVEMSAVRELLDNPPAGKTSRQAFEERYPGVNYDETLLALARAQEIHPNGTTPTPVIDLTRRQRVRSHERLRRAYVDSRPGNIPLTRPLSLTVGGRSSTDVRSREFLGRDTRNGASTANNWFQYGVFRANNGYYSSRRVFQNAETAFRGSGNTQDPRHALNALFSMDTFTSTHRVRGGSVRLDGTATGGANDVLVDPRTGARATGRDISVLAFSGSGASSHRRAFANDARRTVQMFERFGGVPPSQTEVHHNVTPDNMVTAVRGEILRDPRPADQRTDAQGRQRPRTVVVYMAGHTLSSRTHHGVGGYAVTGQDGQGTVLSPQRMQELMQLAEENGVNLVFSVDACRGGEYAHQTRARTMQSHAARGTLSQPVQDLDTLRTGLIGMHRGLQQLSQSRRRHPDVPTSSQLSQLAADALSGGTGSQAYRTLQTHLARMNQADTLPNEEAVKVVVESVDSILQARAGLAGVANMDPQLLNNDILTGQRRWRAGRRFMTYELGPIADRITAQISQRMQAPAITPRDEAR